MLIRGELTGLASGLILEKVCEYLYYHEKYTGVRDVPDMDIPPELCLELLMAADYLHGMLLFSMLGGSCHGTNLI